MDLAELKIALKTMISDIYPYTDTFSDDLYSIDDVVHQLIFEIIKEEYKCYAPKKTITDLLGEYDIDGSHRKYTRALQYAQHFRSYDNDIFEKELGIRVPELEAQDMRGVKVFEGHRFTAHEFLCLKLQAECKLLSKLHGSQIESSKKVSEVQFQKLFENYANKIDELEPLVNEPESVICNTFVYYGIETYFLTEFIYRLTLAAEKAGFPKECPLDRILTVCAITSVIPETLWYPVPAFLADFCMIPKWGNFCNSIFFDSEEEWEKKALLILDCKHIKNAFLQRN